MTYEEKYLEIQAMALAMVQAMENGPEEIKEIALALLGEELLKVMLLHIEDKTYASSIPEKYKTGGTVQ